MKQNTYTKALLMCILLVLNVEAQITAQFRSPANTQRFDACAEIPLALDITVQSGEIYRVSYYSDGLILKTVTRDPFDEYTWEGAPNGIYIFYAKVTDKDRNEFWSDTLTIFVDPIQDGDLIKNGEFKCEKSPWTLSTESGGVATFDIEPDSWLSDDNIASIEVLEPGENPWSVMIKQPFSLIKGHTYIFNFMAEAIEPMNMIMSVQTLGGDWHAHIYQTVEIGAGDDFGPFVLTAEEDIPKAEFRLMVGGNGPNVFYFDAVTAIDSNWVAPEGGTAVESYREDNGITSYRLKQNFPNPFNPSTTLEYDIHQTGQVFIGVYNVTGMLVRTLVDARQAQGSHSVMWNGLDDQGQMSESGVYLVKLAVDSKVTTRKVMLVK